MLSKNFDYRIIGMGGSHEHSLWFFRKNKKIYFIDNLKSKTKLLNTAI